MAAMLVNVSALQPPLVEDTGFRTNFWSFMEREILLWLADPLQLHFSVRAPPDLNYGGQMSDGSWNGIIGQLVAKEADLGAASFTYTYSRSLVVDYTVPHNIDKSVLLIPFPEEDSKAFAAFIPFSAEVWGCWIIFILAVWLALWAESKIDNRLFSSTDNISERSHFGIIVVFGILVGQDLKGASGLGGNRLSRRLIIGLWSLCAVVFYNVYGGVLFSVLTVPTYTVAANTLQDLAKNSSTLRFTTVRSTSLSDAILSASNGTFKVIGDSIRNHPESLVPNDIEGVELVATGKYAYGAMQRQIMFIIQEDFEKNKRRCRFTYTDVDYFQRIIGFTIQKKSPLKRILDREMLLMQQSGFTIYWDRTFLFYKDLCKVRNGRIGGSQQGPQPIILKHLLSPFIILGMGTGSAVLVFFFERYSAISSLERLLFRLLLSIYFFFFIS